MPRLPVVSGREVVRALERLGFAQVRQRGSHVTLAVFGTYRFPTGPIHGALWLLHSYDPEADIAEGVLYLADDRAGFVTGVALTIDGGFAAGMSPEQRQRIWAPLRDAVGALAGDE